MTDQPNRTAFNADDERWWTYPPPDGSPSKGIVVGLCIVAALLLVGLGALGSWAGWW